MLLRELPLLTLTGNNLPGAKAPLLQPIGGFKHELQNNQGNDSESW